MKKEKQEKFVRLNSRVRQDQLDYIKKHSLKHKMSEGETNRMIIDEFINSRIIKKDK